LDALCSLESAAAIEVLEAMGAISAAESMKGRTYCERLYAMLTRMVGKKE
jgi:hypothetical protein